MRAAQVGRLRNLARGIVLILFVGDGGGRLCITQSRQTIQTVILVRGSLLG